MFVHSDVVVSAVVADGEEASAELITNQALVRKAVDWQRWPLKGATFIPNADQQKADGVEDCGEMASPPLPVS